MSSKIDVDTYVNVDESGVTIGGFIGDDDCPAFEQVHTWDSIFETEFEYVSLPSGQIVVDHHSDGVQDMLQLVDSLRKVADELEDRIRHRKVLIRERLDNVSSLEEACVSFSKYMRSQYQ